MFSSVIIYRPLFFGKLMLLGMLSFGNKGNAQKAASAAEIPVLCYHQIRNYTPVDGSTARAYTVTPENFAAHMKMLADSGFHTILPDDLYYWLTLGRALPDKPVLITFDDNTISQYMNAVPVLKKHGFKAVFFVMTVSLNKPNYMSSAQLKELQQQGFVMGGHSWDHKNMRHYTDADWKVQLDDSFKTLEGITGEQPRFFAYPFGAWSQKSLGELQKRGIKLAFTLNTKSDAKNPLLTVRRLLVAGSFSANTLNKHIKQSFHQ
jgi:peptidoglycan/xylan/chitin deacetylase (PgdA/CDA1 family)